MRTGREERHIISKANRANTDPTHVKSKARGLGGDQLFCVDHLKLVTRVDSSLLHSSPIMDRAHQGGGELEVGTPGGQPVGQVQQAGVSLVTRCSISTSKDMLLQDRVKSSLLVQKHHPQSNA